VFLVGDVTTAWIGAMDDIDVCNSIMVVTGGGNGEVDVGDDGITIGAEVGVVVTTTGWSVVGTDVMV
jgi:hypothetical protein